jgi:hypothetical protein
MSLWGVMWLTCLCGSMEDAWTWNCRLALERNSLGSSIPMIHSLCGMWRICGCRSTWSAFLIVDKWKGLGISEIRGHGCSMVWGLTKPTMGVYNGTRLHEVEHFCLEQEENIWRMGNLRRQFVFLGCHTWRMCGVHGNGKEGLQHFDWMSERAHTHTRLTSVSLQPSRFGSWRHC